MVYDACYKLFRSPGQLGDWAQASELKPFVKLAATIVIYQQRIEAGLLNGLSNARVESLNSKIRLITCRGFGFRYATAIIALQCSPSAGSAHPSPDEHDVTHGNSRRPRY